jgi:RNA polymerase sigma factor (sigma-70 family)
MESDLQLLQQYAKSHDADVFADLVTRYAGMVYATCLRVTGNVHAAEDASQECFLQLARQAGSIRQSLAGWLHCKAVSQALTDRRSEARRKRREEGSARIHTKASSDEPTWAEISPYVDEALAGLPRELRDVLVRHYLQRKTQAEVAEELRVDQSTVSRRMAKGLKSLRSALKRRGVIVTSAVLGIALGAHTSSAAPAALTIALGKMAMAGISGGGTAAGASATLTIGGVVVTTKAIIISAVAAGAIISAVTVTAIASSGKERGGTTATPDATTVAAASISNATAEAPTEETGKILAALMYRPEIVPAGYTLTVLTPEQKELYKSDNPQFIPDDQLPGCFSIFKQVSIRPRRTYSCALGKGRDHGMMSTLTYAVFEMRSSEDAVTLEAAMKKQWESVPPTIRAYIFVEHNCVVMVVGALAPAHKAAETLSETLKELAAAAR